MWSYNQTDALTHFGVKGMKWGIRRHTRIAEARRKDAKDFQKDGLKEEARWMRDLAKKHEQKALALQKKLDLKTKDISSISVDKVKKGKITAAKILAGAFLGLTATMVMRKTGHL